MFIFPILVFHFWEIDLYGGSLEDGILRQALHCHSLAFYHPFLEEELRIESSLPDDFSQVLKQLSNI